MTAALVPVTQHASDIVEDAAAMPLDKRWHFIFASFAEARPELREAIVAAVIVEQSGVKARAGAAA